MFILGNLKTKLKYYLTHTRPTMIIKPENNKLTSESVIHC